MLASRLSEDRAARVLLVEAGPRDRRREIAIPAAFPQLLRTECDWGYSSAPQPALGGRSIYLPRGKTRGGSSATNAMVFQRGHPVNFERWPPAATRAGRGAVLPTFKRMENWRREASALRGRGGPVEVTDLRDPNPLTASILDPPRGRG